MCRVETGRFSGAIPAGWESVQLGDIFEHVVDAGHTDDLPILAVTIENGVVHRSSLERRADRTVARNQHLRVNTGDIAYNTMRMWQGASGVVPEPGYLSPAYTVCRTKGSECADYWAYCFKAAWMIRRFLDQSQGVAKDRFRLYFRDFATVRSVRPPLPEQRKIAAILSAVGEVIEKTEVVIERLRAVKQAMMEELLTRGLPSRHTRFKQTEIGEIPVEWDLVQLAKIAVVQTGIAKGKKVEGNAAEIPYLRVANVQDGHVDLKEMKTIRVEPRAVERYGLVHGDVLFTEGGDADKLGRGCVWRGQIEPCLHQNHVFAVRPDVSRLLPEFLAFFAASPAGKCYFLNAAKQTTNLASINSTQLKALPVPLPSINEQKQIVDALAMVQRRSDAEFQSLTHQRHLKSALMSVLLTGELRVTPAESPA